MTLLVNVEPSISIFEYMYHKIHEFIKKNTIKESKHHQQQ